MAGQRYICMMNQYYGCAGRQDRRGNGYEHGPMRGRMARGAIDRGSYPFGRMASGCGSGLPSSGTLPCQKPPQEDPLHGGTQAGGRGGRRGDHACGCGSRPGNHSGCCGNRPGNHACGCGSRPHDHACGTPGKNVGQGNSGNGGAYEKPLCDGVAIKLPCPEAKHLMAQIRAVDFALYEVILYLDVYPHACDALETYQKLRARSHELHRDYEAQFGPLTAFGNESSASWDWMQKPAPWEFDAE